MDRLGDVAKRNALERVPLYEAERVADEARVRETGGRGSRAAELPEQRGQRLTPKVDVRPVRPKLGRNEKCWCGSGKKYKRCHWQEDRSR